MRELNRFLVLFPILIILSGCTSSVPLTQAEQGSDRVEASDVDSSEPFSYEDYAAVLETYVNEEGLVDYQALQANRDKLDRFNAAIGAVDPGTYASWSDEKKIAFLINAYNSFTLQSIIDQNPLPDSIRDIPGVWRIRKFEIAGELKTLDNIEHETLRKNFNEPRIHAALVCAAMSCPPLLREPYTAEKLDAQLDDRVNVWLESPIGLRFDRSEDRVYISAIFDWFGEDWQPTYGVKGERFTGSDRERAILNFISNYVEAEQQDYLAKGNYEIKYLDYDWSLNRH